MINETILDAQKIPWGLIGIKTLFFSSKIKEFLVNLFSKFNFLDEARIQVLLVIIFIAGLIFVIKSALVPMLKIILVGLIIYFIIGFFI